MAGTRMTRVNRQRVLVVAVLSLLLGVGCAGQLPPVLLEGRQSDLARLVGEWTGNYISDRGDDPGGSILFTLEVGGAVAHGDVLMTRRGAIDPFHRYDAELPGTRTLGFRAQSLTILFVRADDGVISGELDPYWDFDRLCQARTIFRGRQQGNVITGTYETTYGGAFPRSTGRWQVKRGAPSLALRERN